jgi:hypothetical protein
MKLGNCEGELKIAGADTGLITKTTTVCRELKELEE